MTFSINASKTWRQLKTRYLLAAAGALAAFAIVAGGEALPGVSGSATTPRASSVPPSEALVFESPATAPDLLVYITGSHSEKEALEHDARFNEWFRDPGVGLDPVVTRVVVIGPGEEEGLGVLADLLPEAGMTTGIGPRMTLVDLR
jgi:hypothetical protein